MKTLCYVLISLMLLVAPAARAGKLYSNTSHGDHRKTPKLLFLEPGRQKTNPDGQQAARAYLQTHAADFGLPADLANLKPVRVKHSLLGKHYYYQQILNGLPVDSAEICVSISNKSGQPYRAFNNTYPVTQPVALKKTLIGKNKALDIAWKHLRVHGKLLQKPKADLLYIPEGKGFRLVYKADTDTEAPFGYWRHTIDAETGKILFVKPRQLSRKTVKMDFDSYNGPVADRKSALAEFDVAQTEEVQKTIPPVTPPATTDGTGKVFDPDPRQTLNNAAIYDYSPAATFTAAYRTRTLKDITENAGIYSLTGPYCYISDFEPPSTNAPSTTTDGNWTAVRGDNAFNDAMTYYHIDKSQRHIQSLGYTGIQNAPIETDTDGFNGADNSHYLGGINNQLAFGHGGVDDNDDADVILHEYWHAMQYAINPSWGGADSGAMGEGFGDYWGASYCYEQTNGTTFNPHWAFSWDGHSVDTWAGRFLNITGQYDPAETYPDHTTVNGVYSDELWGTPIFQAFLALRGLGRPRDEMDTIVIESNFGMGANVRMPDMANSMIAAAEALYPAGIHAQVYFNKFTSNNIIQPRPPVLLYPTGGEYFATGATINVRWDDPPTYPTGRVAVVEYTPGGSITYSEGFETGLGGWTVSHAVGTVDWSRTTVDKHGGSYSFFAANHTTNSDLFLISPQLACPTNAELSFWHYYDTEDGFDGGVIEISTTGTSGPWSDLGSKITQNGYNSTLSSSYGNPIGGQDAFSGNSGGWLATTVDLSAYSGLNIHMRFRMASDINTVETGWYVDDIRLAHMPIWYSVGSSSPNQLSLPWTLPLVTGATYAARVKCTAPGYTDSDWTVGSAFTIDNDDDRDRLANLAETLVYGSDPDDPDSDDDGMDDGDEVTAGTILTNSASVLMVTAVNDPINGRVPVTFASVSGIVYNVRGITDLVNTAWAPADYSLTPGGPLRSGNLTGTTSSTLIFVDMPPARKYYRLAVDPD